MTCLEKYLTENPSENQDSIIRNYCPNMSGGILIEDMKGCDYGVTQEVCILCWNREVPNTEVNPQPTDTSCTHDPVNHPKHYCREGAMQCIDEMIMVFGVGATMQFCLLNAWKYRYRAADKGGEEDLKKSDWYLAKYKELKEGD